MKNTDITYYTNFHTLDFCNLPANKYEKFTVKCTNVQDITFFMKGKYLDTFHSVKRQSIFQIFYDDISSTEK